ncbi:Signal transduction histidine kinase CheA [hydrothermal vent metagenome]|uniref:histidine kinase n=1 Tax=hydrothermal vent metagenome TaxID=652676 RepID=A0A3B1BCG1_9ZZZZ
MDDELLQDFLVEAGEILESLSEQLVDLEQSPDDMELLNTVFRGFHTIKGGAGFLAIDAMVALCHRSEDIFNLLRNGERTITPELMDTILPVLDVLGEQFEALRNGDEVADADPAMLNALEKFTKAGGQEETSVAPEVVTPSAEVSAEASPASGKVGGGEDITDAEFDELLNVLDAGNKPAVGGDSENITEDEFDALLDELHGTGKFDPGNLAAAVDSDSKETPSTENKAPENSSTSDEMITEDEFEALLDELHGKGKFEAKKTDAGQAVTVAGNTAPAAVVVEKKVAEAKPKKAEKKAPGKDKPPAETSVRVDTSRLDDIMNMVGELVLVRNRITRLGERSGNEEMLKAVANLDLVTADLQLSVMKTRMQPIKKVFGRFPRVVRDIARSLKKEIRLEMVGEDTDLDKNLVEALADPLVHLVRNSLDHGIEMPDEREAAGKPREGTVVLAASQEGDHILLSIEDDGKGMDPDILRNIAVDKGLMDREAAERLTNKECYELIFAPGFSTKKEISDISGRGVGMDVVKTGISRLNGTVDIDSELGKGTRLSIKVPLTLAIMSTLMVRLEDQLFALPLVNVSEIFHLDLTQTNIVDGQLVILVRERSLPLFYLNRWLVKGQSNAELPKQGHVVVVHIGTQKIGFVVDELIGQEEVVIKPLGALLHGLSGMAGATITGDGGIAIILDVPGLIRMYV